MMHMYAIISNHNHANILLVHMINHAKAKVKPCKFYTTTTCRAPKLTHARPDLSAEGFSGVTSK